MKKKASLISLLNTKQRTESFDAFVELLEYVGAYAAFAVVEDDMYT